MTTTLWIHVSETKSPDVPTYLYPAKHTRQGCHILLCPTTWHNSPIVQARQKGRIFQSSCIHEVSISFQLLVQVMARFLIYLYLGSYTINTGSICYEYAFFSYRKIIGRNILRNIHSQKLEKKTIDKHFQTWLGKVTLLPSPTTSYYSLIVFESLLAVARILLSGPCIKQTQRGSMQAVQLLKFDLLRTSEGFAARHGLAWR